MTIIADTREQKPVWNHLKGECSRSGLLVGDYTTRKLLDKFHIERKSPQDLYSTLTHAHARFRNELIRAEVNGIVLVMFVECSRDNFVNKVFPGGSMRKCESTTLEKIVSTVERRYKLEIVWCNDRDVLKNKILKRLRKEERNHGTTKRRKTTGRKTQTSSAASKQRKQGK